MNALRRDVASPALLTGDREAVLNDGDLELVWIDPRGQGLDVEALAIVGDVHQRVLARASSRQERETARGSRTSRPPGAIELLPKSLELDEGIPDCHQGV